MVKEIGLVAASATVGMAGAVAPAPWSLAWFAGFMPVVVAVIVVIITRELIEEKSRVKNTRKYNILLMALCAIVTAGLVREYELGVVSAILTGLGVGTTGIGILAWGKPLLAALLSKAQSALSPPPDDLAP